MDILGLEVGKRDDPGDGLVDAVNNVFVNGRNLVDLLREVGSPFAARRHLSASSRLLGEPTTYYDHDNP